MKFIARRLQQKDPFTELCEHAGISRKSGYKWVERYDGGGVSALVDKSRAPRSHPHAVSSAVVELIVATRRRHPSGAHSRCLRCSGVKSRLGPGPSRARSVTSCAEEIVQLLD